MQASGLRWWVRYGAAIVAVGMTLGIKLLLIPIVSQHEPYVLFFAAVLISAWVGGLGPGLLATALATLFNFYFFVPPFNRLDFENIDEMVQLLLSVFDGICITVICNMLRAARTRAEENAREARELEARILDVSDAEQRRIGHDLHDGLGQHLTGIALMTRRLQQRLEERNLPDAADAEKISDLATGAVQWTHDLVRTLSPPVLESGGLAEALRELATRVESIFNIHCTFEQAGESSWRDVAAGAQLYRIAQESISNAVKHGKAKTVTIALAFGPREIVMLIQDDGVGFDTTPDASDGMGLRIMQYRAKMIGGDVNVQRRPGGGMAVTCRYPFGWPQLADSSNGRT